MTVKITKTNAIWAFMILVAVVVLLSSALNVRKHLWPSEVEAVGGGVSGTEVNVQVQQFVSEKIVRRRLGINTETVYFIDEVVINDTTGLSSIVRIHFTAETTGERILVFFAGDHTEEEMAILKATRDRILKLRKEGKWNLRKAGMRDSYRFVRTNGITPLGLRDIEDEKGLAFLTKGHFVCSEEKFYLPSRVPVAVLNTQPAE